jgi:hypothetical protein
MKDNITWSSGEAENKEQKIHLHFASNLANGQISAYKLK